MAYVRKTGVKCTDELGDGHMLQIRGRRGKLLITPREADEILADLQIIYHEKTLEMYHGNEEWEPE